MSCFIVSHYHINTILTFAAAQPNPTLWVACTEYDLGNTRDASAIGALLHAANVASFQQYYTDRLFTIRPFTFQRQARVCAPVQCLKALECLEYNSDSLPEWATSPAKEALEAIKLEAIHALPGYEAAWWEALDTPAYTTF